MPRPRVHDDAVRTRLLEVASEAISAGGPDALSLRDVARRAGTSTTAVYTLFGGRAELVAAVGDEGFRRFAAHLAAAPRTGDPRADLLALGLAYRTSALADPHFYRVMFEVAGTGARGRDAAPATERPTFGALRDGVRAALGPRAADAVVDEVALTLWGLVHGLVGLELAGLTPGTADERAERYARALRTAGAAAVEAAARGLSDGSGTLTA